MSNILFIIGFVFIIIYIVIDLAILNVKSHNLNAKNVNLITFMMFGDLLAFLLVCLAYDETDSLKLSGYLAATLIILIISHLVKKN